MLFTSLLALLPLAAAAPVDLVKRQSFSGRATFYDVGLGACGGYNVASDFIVALNSPQYGGGYPGPNCGRQLTISYGGKSATATVRDQCPGCGYGDLDMSRGLFNYFASEDKGVFQMSWSWADGSGGGNNQPEPTTTKAPEPSTTPSPTPTPTPTSTYTPPTTTASPSPSTTPIVQVQVQASSSSTTTAAASSSSDSASASASASGPDSASVSGSASASSASASASATPGDSQVLASDGNLAAIANAVVALGKIVITGSNDTASA